MNVPLPLQDIIQDTHGDLSGFDSATAVHENMLKLLNEAVPEQAEHGEFTGYDTSSNIQEEPVEND